MLAREPAQRCGHYAAGDRGEDRHRHNAARLLVGGGELDFGALHRRQHRRGPGLAVHAAQLEDLQPVEERSQGVAQLVAEHRQEFVLAPIGLLKVALEAPERIGRMILMGTGGSFAPVSPFPTAGMTTLAATSVTPSTCIVARIVAASTSISSASTRATFTPEASATSGSNVVNRSER